MSGIVCGLLVLFVAEEVRASGLPAGKGAMAPSLTVTADTLILSWLEPAAPTAPTATRPDRWRLRMSAVKHEGWSEPVTVVEADDLFVNWADVPSVAVASDGSRVAHWLQKSAPSTYAYDVKMARSKDGLTWTHLGSPHTDGTPTEHGFVSMVPTDDALHVFWLDGREMSESGGDGHGHGSGNMTLRAGTLKGSLADGQIIDPRVCECCNTSAVKTGAGSVIFYRDRGPSEVRDIFYVQQNGDRWTPPRAVYPDGWRTASCPVNGPAADAIGQHLAVAWFSGAVSEGIVRVAFSGDGADKFDAPITIDDTAPLGRVDLVMTGQDSGIVSWLDTSEFDGTQGEIKLVRVRRDGHLGPVQRVARVSLARSTGFPVMAIHDAKLMLVWTGEDKLDWREFPLDRLRR